MTILLGALFGSPEGAGKSTGSGGQYSIASSCFVQTRVAMLLFTMHIVRIVCFNMLSTTWEARCNSDSVNEKAETMDEEEVELEKSNILLMGPTGSGNLSLSVF